jgi:hypothetical protein
VRQLLLPATDAGAIGQIVGFTVLWVSTLVIVRRSREARILVAGIGLVVLGWFGVRAMH